MVGRQAQVFEPVHEVRREHLAFAIEGIAAHPSGLAARQGQGPDVIKLLPQLALVHQIGKADGFGAVDQRKFDLHVTLVAEYRLAHQQFVEVGIDQGPDDRVDLPFVVPDTGGDVDHGVLQAFPSG